LQPRRTVAKSSIFLLSPPSTDHADILSGEFSVGTPPFGKLEH
jgi:hypothetical protein